MIKAFWFAIKVGLVVAIAIWIAERPGFVRIEWLDYVATIQMGFFLLLCVIAILISIFVYRVIAAIVNFPKTYQRYLEVRGYEKGVRALTLGMAAVAAGDEKIAVYQAHRATKLMPEDTGLTNLLTAQAARLDGREDDAVRAFARLLENKEASFLGVRGLLQAAIDKGDYETAKNLVDRALGLYPKQGWILKTAFDVYVRAEDYTEARVLLKRAAKAGTVKSETLHSDLAALYLAEALQDFEAARNERGIKLIKQALKKSKDFIPASVALIQYYIDNNDISSASKLLKKYWRREAHDLYVPQWLSIYKGASSEDKLKHMQSLLKINEKNAVACMETGKAALESSLWGEARKYFEKAESIEPTASLYRSYAQLEELSIHDEAAARTWLEKAINAPVERQWVCQETGRLYTQWKPIAQPHGAFNSMIWGRSTDLQSDNALLIHSGQSTMQGLVHAV
ncbi:MAG: hypothetical protein CBB87_06775 [Micavibrio sp. TMED27]|nr:MAG: hypothetical protein CBB87_06775 [Micavibrio sp. TMED27]